MWQNKEKFKNAIRERNLDCDTILQAYIALKEFDNFLPGGINPFRAQIDAISEILDEKLVDWAG